MGKWTRYSTCLNSSSCFSLLTSLFNMVHVSFIFWASFLSCSYFEIMCLSKLRQLSIWKATMLCVFCIVVLKEENSTLTDSGISFESCKRAGLSAPHSGQAPACSDTERRNISDVKLEMWVDSTYWADRSICRSKRDYSWWWRTWPGSCSGSSTCCSERRLTLPLNRYVNSINSRLIEDGTLTPNGIGNAFNCFPFRKWRIQSCACANFDVLR